METEHPADDILQGLAEGTLSLEGIPGLPEHLEGCPVCRGNLEAYRALFRVLAADPPPLPEGFVGEVMASVRVTGTARPGRLRTAWKAAAIGAAAAVFVVVMGVLDLDRKGLDLAPGLTSEMGERIPEEIPIPVSVEGAVTRAFDRAEEEWAGVVHLTEEALGNRRSFGVPFIAGIIALLGVLNLAAFWKLRADRTGGQP
ncbi:MAG: hypothetical protein ACYS47_02190 [Planctomycetota bacterium]|jgi:hypothetical protein